MSSRSASAIRNDSRFAVLRTLLSFGTASRQELAVATDLSTATVANVVTELLDAGLLHVVGKGASVGRPSARLAINESLLRLVGVDVAETYVTAAVYSLSLTRLLEHTVALDDSDQRPDVVVDGVVKAVHGALELADVAPDRIGGVGISLPGQVIPAGQSSVFVPTWDWHQVELRDQLQPALGLDVGVHIDNPLKAVIVAELWLGGGPSSDTVVVVNLGTGVGAGIAIDGRLLRGRSNNAGEWGHTTLVQDGRLCRCGRRGCVEAYVGVPGLQTTLTEIAPEHPANALAQRPFVQAVAQGLQAGDAALAELLDRTCDALENGLGDIVNLLNPDRLVLCGWMFDALRPWLLPRLTERMDARAVPPARGLEGSLAVLSVGALDVGGPPVTAGMAIFALEDVLARRGLPSRVT